MSDGLKGCAVVLGLVVAIVALVLWGVTATARNLDEYRDASPPINVAPPSTSEEKP